MDEIWLALARPGQGFCIVLLWPQKKGNKMEEAIKDLSIEELQQILKLAQKEIDRRTIKRVEVS